MFEARPEPANGLSVLVVDDERVNRLRLCGLIRQFGHQPLEADSGEAALACFAGQPVDVVLMDVVLPGISGFDAAVRIRELAGARWVPVIFLSGLNEKASRDRWIDLGDDYLTKPVDIQLLQARLRSMGQAIFHERHAREVAEGMAREQRLARSLMERIACSSRNQELDAVEMRQASASISSGDCIALEVASERFYLLVADAMGHGLAAAVTLQPAISLFRAMAVKGFEPHLIAREINQKFRQILPRERFISALIAEVDRRHMIVKVFSAGFPAGYLFAADGSVREHFPSQCPPLGILDDQRFTYPSRVVRCHAGDRLLFGSDGFSEAFAGRPQGIEDIVASAAPAWAAMMDVLWQARAAHPVDDDASLVMATVLPLAAGEALPEGRPADGQRRPLARLCLLPEQLRQGLGADAVLAMLGLLGLPALQGDARLMVVLTELLANAVDHGLLHLDSALKTRGAEGCDAYYRLRAERLSVLAGGQVDIELRDGGDGCYEVEVCDTGEGFDARREAGIAPAEAVVVGGGRGLQLVRRLCERLEHFDLGTRTVAALTWPAPAENGAAGCAPGKEPL